MQTTRSPVVYVGCSLAARQGAVRSNHLKSQGAIIATLLVERFAWTLIALVEEVTAFSIRNLLSAKVGEVIGTQLVRGHLSIRSSKISLDKADAFTDKSRLPVRR
jgi:hypothetical protein